jgi:hypothetical protein
MISGVDEERDDADRLLEPEQVINDGGSQVS